MLLRRLFGIALDEARPDIQGLPAESAAAADRLRRIGEAFLFGYHRALDGPDAAELVAAITDGVAPGWRVFGHEGAGFGLALRDALLPRLFHRQSRVGAYLDGPGAPFRHLALVGAGWTLARLPRRIGSAFSEVDPLLRWIPFDGYGFHRAFFSWPVTIDARRQPRRLSGYARRAFDFGVGRCLWFGHGMAAERIAATIGRFPVERRDALWSGVGIAATFAGGAPPEGIAELREMAGLQEPNAAPDVALGAAFAAMMRTEAGEVTEGSESACSALSGRGVAEAAALVRRVHRELPTERNAAGPEPVYEVWRRRTRAALARSGARSL